MTGKFLIKDAETGKNEELKKLKVIHGGTNIDNFENGSMLYASNNSTLSIITQTNGVLPQNDDILQVKNGNPIWDSGLCNTDSVLDICYNLGVNIQEPIHIGSNNTIELVSNNLTIDNINDENLLTVLPYKTQFNGDVYCSNLNTASIKIQNLKTNFQIFHRNQAQDTIQYYDNNILYKLPLLTSDITLALPRIVKNIPVINGNNEFVLVFDDFVKVVPNRADFMYKVGNTNYEIVEIISIIKLNPNGTKKLKFRQNQTIDTGIVRKLSYNPTTPSSIDNFTDYVLV
tara:strand:+ start:3348 stop:4208 length:861 start_codon:yes stop_codon:yes gene_type:complete